MFINPIVKKRLTKFQSSQMNFTSAKPKRVLMGGRRQSYSM